MEDLITVQILGLETHIEEMPEGSKNPHITHARLTVANAKGRFTVKFRGTKAMNLSRDIKQTLAEGETISSKRLFVELKGTFKQFTNDAGRRIRYFDPVDFRIVDGPALQLARLRGEAFDILSNAEELRKAGRVGMAYKAIASYVSELAQFPLDLTTIEEADMAITREMAEEHDPESEAAAHYERKDAAEAAAAAEEDHAAAMAASGSEQDDPDDLILSSNEELSGDDLAVVDRIEISQDDARPELDNDHHGDVHDGSDRDDGIPEEAESDAVESRDAAEPNEDRHAEPDVREAPEAPAPRRFGFGRR